MSSRIHFVAFAAATLATAACRQGLRRTLPARTRPARCRPNVRPPATMSPPTLPAWSPRWSSRTVVSSPSSTSVAGRSASMSSRRRRRSSWRSGWSRSASRPRRWRSTWPCGRPAADLPQLLVRDHERVAMARSGSPAPRLLTVRAAGANGLEDPGHDSDSCEPTGVAWYNDWKAAFVGITKYREGGLPSQPSGVLPLLPGRGGLLRHRHQLEDVPGCLRRQRRARAEAGNPSADRREVEVVPHGGARERFKVHLLQRHSGTLPGEDVRAGRGDGGALRDRGRLDPVAGGDDALKASPSKKSFLT